MTTNVDVTLHGARVARRVARYQQVRATTLALSAPLGPEDCQVQSMPDASPVKWHLAHTTWFFETFLLLAFQPAYEAPQPAFRVLFNSYYNGIGEQHPRPQRGLLTRPSLSEVLAWRSYVDDAMQTAIADLIDNPQFAARLELGLQHEQQHQELILMDVKHLFWSNPTKPAYRPETDSCQSIHSWAMPQATPNDIPSKPGALPTTEAAAGQQPGSAGCSVSFGHHRLDCLHNDAPPLEWISFSGGISTIGHSDETTFSFDNELPAHQQLLHPYQLGSRLVTQGEYLTFMQDDGYKRPELWLSLGWDAVRQQGWQAPLYWQAAGDEWHVFTLNGLQPLEPASPVTHLSYFEADAYARWAAARLPTEAEWEAAAMSELHHLKTPLNVLETAALQALPVIAAEPGRLHQMLGDAWEWTSSAYGPYPGFAAAPGAIGEYNGKFMCNQYVLRGGSWATPAAHIRATYRNFFPPDARWAITGLRLARNG